MFGVGGSKPAKEYTPQESHAVKNKDKYNMRKQFWLKCAENTEMVHAGWDANVAINQFYLAYNHGHYWCQNLTAICNIDIESDKKDARARARPTRVSHQRLLTLCVSLPSL